ncbi:MAG: restriction endonuclease [Bacteroidota bacterium]|nr:restriction endonuclease [Flavobacteriales bacterium]MDQ3193089.1 restriction endonuclease [Bacteroidota bacterium]
MSKVAEAQQILEAFGLPKAQQNERSALILLALSNLKEEDDWKKAKKISMSVVGSKENAKYKGIMRFISKYYDKHYAENSRETLRRQTLHQFVQAGIVNHNPENPNLPTNSKDNHYRLTDEAIKVIKSFGSINWNIEVGKFRKKIGTLKDKYTKQRIHRMLPVKLANGKELLFSPGKHNEVQIAIIEEFAPRFAPGSQLLYIGDTAKKDLYTDDKTLKKLGIPIDQHSKLPDVVLFDSKRNWLFLIEAVTSHGPVSPKRIVELEEMLKNCKVGKVYVSAFPDFKEFKKHTPEIAWETEVWVVEFPEHMIHFNGDRFMGPRN